MSSSITQKDAAKVQSMLAKEGQDTGKGTTAAVAQSEGDKNFEKGKKATEKGFCTKSNYDEPSTKPDYPMD
ncbi:uncharacterized protein BX663DRAFT_495299 [Cokeromyces recurvatus]|uniref:uncharacterized protein n=1 Tax=Cokeromyces recurvatus TaxID=90255 RepID=UPI00221FD000|nr:uncharacterized protein BX663DRAFT_495299 [Cokeromyces recurvatus]KAI7907244.1 hypothetical protein BX663DRAFT_495299 [Cokeromyces recurvatus]